MSAVATVEKNWPLQGKVTAGRRWVQSVLSSFDSAAPPHITHTRQFQLLGIDTTVLEADALFPYLDDARTCGVEYWTWHSYSR